MLLTPQDAALFFKLQLALMSYANLRLNTLPDTAGPKAFEALPAERRAALRDALLANLELIQSFVDENPSRLTADELDIVRSWRHPVVGHFYILRELKKYTVFLSTEKPPVAYGVVALTQPFEEVIGPYFPIYVDAVLLPFKNQIIYDGLLAGHNLSFGGGVKRMLNASYEEAKKRHGIVTSLPMTENSAKENKPRPKRKPKNILGDLPARLPKELTQTLLRASGIRIERIISHGHASPDGFWYDQDQPEWVLLLSGGARLRFEDEEPVEMKIGSFLNIPAHSRHRVDWTDPNEPTIWLAVHYSLGEFDDA